MISDYGNPLAVIKTGQLGRCKSMGSVGRSKCTLLFFHDAYVRFVNFGKLLLQKALVLQTPAGCVVKNIVELPARLDDRRFHSGNCAAVALSAMLVRQRTYIR